MFSHRFLLKYSPLACHAEHACIDHRHTAPNMFLKTYFQTTLFLTLTYTGMLRKHRDQENPSLKPFSANHSSSRRYQAIPPSAAVQPAPVGCHSESSPACPCPQTTSNVQEAAPGHGPLFKKLLPDLPEPSARQD